MERDGPKAAWETDRRCVDEALGPRSPATSGTISEASCPGASSRLCQVCGLIGPWKGFAMMNPPAAHCGELADELLLSRQRRLAVAADLGRSRAVGLAQPPHQHDRGSCADREADCRFTRLMHPPRQTAPGACEGSATTLPSSSALRLPQQHRLRTREPAQTRSALGVGGIEEAEHRVRVLRPAQAAAGSLQDCVEVRLCCRDQPARRITPFPLRGSHGANVLRASKVEHAV